MTDKDLKGIVSVMLFIAQDEPEVIDLTAICKLMKVMFKDGILQSHYYKLPFGRLTVSQHRI